MSHRSTRVLLEDILERIVTEELPDLRKAIEELTP